MTMNLFEMFNPLTTSWLSSNWMMASFLFIFPMPAFWVQSSIINHSFTMLNEMMFNQFKNSMMKINMSSILAFSCTMIMIMIINLSGLFPFIFTSTSHISFNLTISAMLWSSFLIHKMMMYEKTLAHFTPPGTPKYLISFMTMIEFISFIIQPITLAVRLTANITAGHLLLTLISSAMLSMMSFLPMMIPQLMFVILEMAVAMIQAYVFSILMIMFMK